MSVFKFREFFRCSFALVRQALASAVLLAYLIFSGASWPSTRASTDNLRVTRLLSCESVVLDLGLGGLLKPPSLEGSWSWASPQSFRSPTLLYCASHLRVGPVLAPSGMDLPAHSELVKFQGWYPWSFLQVSLFQTFFKSFL